MAEHVLRGEIAVYPRDEGGRHLLVNDTGEVYRIPLPEDALQLVIKELSMSDEELQREQLRRQAAARLTVPEGMNGATAS